ncbi:MAG: excisionase family DNA-binding protein [Phycisphaeraceae bacterium]|nr:excisionase family DNA-binding protein [Phycisphaeraceae bacterium]
MDTDKIYHIFDQRTIDEFKGLIIAIGAELQKVQTWYTVAEAAEYLRCSKRTIGRAVQSGGLRSERLNAGESRGGLRFHHHWLDAFVLGFNAKRLSPVQKRLLADL